MDMIEDVEEVILALKAAGYSMPQYEVLPDGSYHFFHGPKDTNSFIHSQQSGTENGGNADRH